MFRSPARPQPAYGLLTSDPPTPASGALSFGGAAWKHLQGWTRHIEAMPSSPDGLLPETAARLAEVQRLVVPGGTEATHQVSVVDFVDELIRDIESMESLQASALSQGNDDADADAAEDVRRVLRDLGGAAQRIRQRCGPFSAAIQDVRDKILFASQQVVEAHGVEARRLRELQEDIGGLRYEITSLERQIDELGLLGRGKRNDLEARLADRRAASAQVAHQAETLRAALAQLDPVVEGRAWLPQALDDLLSFVDSLQRLCTDFGSAMTQLAVDGTDAQFQDADWLRDALDVAGERYPWQALVSAARSFIEESTHPSSHPVSNPEVIAS